MGHNGLRHRAFRTEWDDLGCFRTADVPLLFPRPGRREFAGSFLRRLSLSLPRRERSFQASSSTLKIKRPLVDLQGGIPSSTDRASAFGWTSRQQNRGRL